MTDRDALSRLVFHLHTVNGWSFDKIAHTANTTEKHVRNLADEGQARALYELQKQQNVQLCGRRIKY